MLTAKEIDSGLSRYADRELDIVKARSKTAAKMKRNGESVRSIVHFMFGIEDSPPDHANIFGNPANTVLLGRKSAITLWPNREVSPDDICGFDLANLQTFVRKGVVFPIIQNPEVYRDIPLLAHLVIQYQPPSYFWRGNMVYSILAGGDENFVRVGKTVMSGPLPEWKRKALSLPVIKQAHLYRATWEPQHQRTISADPDAWDQAYLVDSFSFKYVNACTFLGQDFVDLIISELPAEKALRFLTTFHILTDHPISHAFLTNATVDISSEDWRLFVSNSSEYYSIEELSKDLVSLPLSIWAKPSFDQFSDMLSLGIEPLLWEQTSGLNDFDATQVDELRAVMTRRAHAFNEWAARLDSRATALQVTARVSQFLSAAAATSLGVEPEISIRFLFAGLLADKSVVDKIVDAIKAARLQHTVTKLIGSSKSVPQ